MTIIYSVNIFLESIFDHEFNFGNIFDNKLKLRSFINLKSRKKILESAFKLFAGVKIMNKFDQNVKL